MSRCCAWARWSFPSTAPIDEREVTHIVRDCRPVMAIVDERWAPWIASVDERCVVLSVGDVADARSSPSIRLPISMRWAPTLRR